MHQNISIADSYNFIEKLGKGSFGSVYKIINKNKEIFACKVETIQTYNSEKKRRLKGEYILYKKLCNKNIACIPKVYNYIETPKHNLMIMELLGKGLDTILEDNGGKLDLGTSIKVAISVIKLLENIHSCGIVHRDIKPNNFMFGTNSKKDQLHIMDFGLSKFWINKGKHVEYKSGRSMIGTPRYASINAHFGIEQSRRDDMESAGYMLIYITKGSLPWQGIKKKGLTDKTDRIGEKKFSTTSKILCENLPSCFCTYMEYDRKLEFTSKPNYAFLINLFVQSAEEHKIDIKYTWE